MRCRRQSLTVPVDAIIILVSTICLSCKGAIEDLPKMAEPFKDGKILVVYDNHTYEVAGRKAVQLLKDNGFNIKELMFDTGDDILIPDEKTLGRILQEQDLDTKLMIAVGSGVINDSVKFVTSRTGLPYIIVATAPSMDGYVADGAPIVSHGYKYSPVGTSDLRIDRRYRHSSDCTTGSDPGWLW